jgi:uncharacterized repeat protein (TIGR01451 family)
MIRIEARLFAQCLAAVLLAVLAGGAFPGASAAPGDSSAPATPDPATGIASAQALTVSMSAELEQVQTSNGRVSLRLLPADHVVPGDSLIYTVQVRNTGGVLVAVPQFTAPIPKHTSYVADSAVAPGAEVSYSVDAGQSFDKPQNLRVPGTDGALRAATAADYTHIRWTLRHGLKANSVVYARFRARLN